MQDKESLERTSCFQEEISNPTGDNGILFSRHLKYALITSNTLPLMRTFPATTLKIQCFIKATRKHPAYL